MNELDCALDIGGKPIGYIDHVTHVGRLDHMLVVGIAITKVKQQLDISRNMVGKIDQKCWSAVITRRGENIRLISVRRSRDDEVTIYESEDI